MSNEPRRMVIKIAPTGKATIEAQNITGSGCGDFTKKMQAALGHTTSDVEKPEYHEQSQSETENASH